MNYNLFIPTETQKKRIITNFQAIVTVMEELETEEQKAILAFLNEYYSGKGIEVNNIKIRLCLISPPKVSSAP